MFKKVLMASAILLTMSGYALADCGHASWYGGKFHGRKTASGERFDKWDMTAAHKKLPFGTKLIVTNPRNGKSVKVRINDRGPFIKGRMIDLSRGAASKIGLLERGVGKVCIQRQ